MMVLLISLLYWIPWAFLSYFGHPYYGVLCGVLCWGVWVLYTYMVYR
jgi:membrane-associated protease RseP (regulator of RpoE activity)